jgi:hypothetical protein
MASAGHEEIGGDAVTIRAAAHSSSPHGECFPLCCSKEPEPTILAFATPNRLSDA